VNSLHHKRTNCRLCGHNELDLVLPLRPSAIADAFVPKEKLAEPQPAYPLDLYLCRACGHAQLLDVLDPRILFSNYIYETSVSNSLKEHFRQYAEAVAARQPSASGARVIDIGSNDGTLLRFFKEKGCTVLGIDPAQNIARKATESGIETLPAFFDSKLAQTLRRERGPAAIVTANNVFAHSDNLPDMADGIRELLAPDGIFVFEVSYLLDMVRNLVFDWIYHEHLCYHSIRPLSAFFQHHGLELIDVERVTTKGGSIRCTVQKAGGPKPVQPVVGEMIAEENKVGLHTKPYFDAYFQRIETEKQKLLAVVREAKARGLTVAGYGASATTTTLTYHFELGPHLDFLFDDDRLRHHLYSPGYHLPVLPGEMLEQKQPGLVVLLAWRYAEPIASRHRAYLQAGGRFVVPLPDLREITAADYSK
jgi:SAM-dependent methyltransferase